MNEVLGIGVVFIKNGDHYEHTYHCDYLLDIELNLPEEKEYRLSLDQSSSVTGFHIKSTDNEFFALFDIINQIGPQGKDRYLSIMKTFVARNINNRKITHIVSEKPVPKKNTRYTNEILQQVLGTVNTWKEDIMELWEAEYCKLFPNVHRKYANFGSMPKDKYELKRFVADKIVEVYPFLQYYLDVYLRTNGNRLRSVCFDSFEAVAIMYGFEKYAFDDAGREKIHGDQEYMHHAYVYYKYVDKKVSNIYDLIPEYTHDAILMENEPIKFLVFQERATLFDNIRMASSNYPISFTLVPKKYFDIIKMKYLLQADPNKVLVMIVTRKHGNINQAAISALNDRFLYNEIVLNDKVR